MSGNIYRPCASFFKVNSLKNITNESTKFDSIDRALITSLHQNARMSLRALSRHVGLSAPGCSDRLKRLEAAGVISGFSLELNAQALGYALQAMVRGAAFSGKISRRRKASPRFGRMRRLLQSHRGRCVRLPTLSALGSAS